jgi:ankyrin repeat protein
MKGGSAGVDRGPPPAMILTPDDPLAVALGAAIRAGDGATLERLLAERPGLAGARLGDERKSRALLHVATDWPGHFPNGAATIAVLVGAGADVNARFVGSHSETPLHWAASSGDVEAIDALLDAGADIDAPGAVIGGGTPLGDACAFGQWQAARRLVARGARTTSFEAAALGLLDRLEASLASARPASAAEVDNAFWGACHGGQRSTAEYLLARGADVNRLPPWERLTPLDAALRSEAAELAEWLRGEGALPAAALP